MKIHLPNPLRKALLACFSTAVAGFTTSLSSAAITDGLQWAESFDGSGYVEDMDATFVLGGAPDAFSEEIIDGNVVGAAGSGSLASNRVYSTNLSAGNFTDAFTISFTLVDFDGANWCDVLSMYSNGTTSGVGNSIQLQKNSAGELMVYTTAFSGSNVTGNNANFKFGHIANDLLGKVLTLTYADNMLMGYVDGTAIEDTVTFTFAEGVTPSTALTGFQFGCAFGNNRPCTKVVLDNIALWNRALTATEIAYYLNKNTPTVLLEQNFTAVSALPEGWTSGQWNSWNTPHFNFSADKGVTVAQAWKQNSLQKAITLKAADGFNVNFTTYSTTADKGCIFYMSSADYSIVMGQSYNSNAYVSVGYLESGVITREENATVEGAKMLSFQSGTHAIPTLFDATATSNNSDLNHAGSLTYDIIVNGTSLSVTVTDGSVTWSDSFTIQSGITFDKIGFVLDGSPDTVGIKNITISTKSPAVEESPYITSGAINWAGGTSGNWSGESWTSGSDTTARQLGSGWKDSATFSGTEASTITVDAAATVKNLTVQGTSFTLQKNDSGTLAVENKLTVGAGGTLVLNMPISAKDVVLDAADATLTVSAYSNTPTITGKVSAVKGGTIDASAFDDDNDEFLLLDGAELGGGVVLKGTVVLKDSTITGAINNTEALLYLNGSMVLDIEKIDASMEADDFIRDSVTYHYAGGEEADSFNGYRSASYRTSKLFSATNIPGVDMCTWTYADGTSAIIRWGTGENEILIDGTDSISTEYFAADRNVAAVYDATREEEFGRATALVLDGGSIVLKTNLALKGSSARAAGGIRALQDGSVTVGSGVVLDQDSLNPGDKEITVLGAEDATYDIGAEKAIKTGVTGITQSDWKGVVVTSAADISSLAGLGNAASGVKLTGDVVTDTLDTAKVGRVSAKSLTANKIAGEGTALTVEGATQLKSGDTVVDSADFQGGLTLGDGTNAATLTVNGALTLSKLNVTSAGSYVVAGSLTNDAVDIVMSEEDQKQLDTASLLQLTADDTLPTITLNGQPVVDSVDDGSRYFTSVGWVNNQMVLSIVPNKDYVKQNVEAETENGQAGAAMLDAAFVAINPTTGTMADMLDAVGAGAVDEDALTAVAGASTAVLGMAAIGDVDRQLQSIRNRTTTMGVNQEEVHFDMPYFNVWINAEGGRGELKQSGTSNGYELSSWGGTVGFDVDICPTFTAGLALTAMYGDLDALGADAATGDMDTYYVTAFARYCASAWTHTFVATAGMADISLERTVWGDKVEGDTDGMSFGLLYEVGRVFNLDEDGDACIQPIFNVAWRHTSVDGYKEKGSDMALEVGDQDLNVVTFGAGARVQAVVGQSFYNRTSIFECRALVKVDAGDRSSSTEVAFASLKDARQEVESNELGALGLELGGGLIIPVGENTAAIFADASIELRADYQNINAAVGYRMNF